MKLFFCGVFIFLCISITKGNGIIIDDAHFGVDKKLGLILVNQDIDVINSEFIGTKSYIVIAGHEYRFNNPVESMETGTLYEITDNENNFYNLYFTQLPLIHITTSNIIVDEPKVSAYFTMVESNSKKTNSIIGIEYRGGYTQQLPKKSYRIEFWTNEKGEQTKDVSLLELRSDDDWNLQAMYNEPLRMRNKTNFDIWRKINTLHYQEYEKNAINGSRWKYAELFLNNEYKGVFAISEPVDRKQLQLTKYSEGKGIQGELYKGKGWGANQFRICPPYNNDEIWWVNDQGHGFECIYPNEVFPDWKNLYDFVYFAINAPDMEFYDRYKSYFNFENLLDYFIFLNLLRATDNSGNNLFIARRAINDLYFYVPWDLDGTFGIIWDGSRQDITDDLLTHKFYDRVLNDFSQNGFRERLKERWTVLRKDWLNTENIINMFRENYDYLLRNGVYEREQIAWPDYDYESEMHFIYMTEWLEKRLDYLDNTFITTKIDNIEIADIQPPYDIRIYSPEGQLRKTILKSRTLDNYCKGLNPGIYIVHIQAQTSNDVRKIVVGN